MELLLLVFFCLLTGSEVTFGAETTVIRVNEGSDATLPCSLREDITNKKFVWKKDGRQVFLYDAGDHSNFAPTGQDQQFKGRVSHFPRELKSGIASIIISNMKLAETGLYTCEFPDLQPRQIFHIQLYVGPTFIRGEEGSDVILPCSLNRKEDITKKKFEWKKDGRQVFLYDDGDHSNNVNTGQDQQFIQRVSHFPDKLKSGDASITISNMKVAETGNYTCEFPDLQPRQIFYVKLLVFVAVPQPSVRILDQTGKSALLQCEVRGAFPKPELHWEDGAGNKLPAEEPLVTKRGGLYDIILQTIVIKTDRYRCVAEQKEINHQTHADIYVHIPVLTGGETAGVFIVVVVVAVVVLYGLAVCIIIFLMKGKAKPYIKILDQTGKSALLQCEVQGAFPKPELHWEDSAGNKLPAEKPLVTKRGGHYDITLQTTVTKTDIYRCFVKQKEIYHQTHAYIYVHFTGPTVVKVDEGRVIILPCLLREDITNKKFVWKKDDRQVFLYDNGTVNSQTQDQQFRGRVSHLPGELKSGNASIIIIDMKVADTGLYTCEFPDLQPRQIFDIQLYVEPTVIRVEDGKDATLSCLLHTEDITNKKFVWKKDDRQVFLYDKATVNSQTQDQQFRERVVHLPDELESGNASITIRNTKAADTGLYTCVFPDQPEQIFHIKLVFAPTAVTPPGNGPAGLPTNETDGGDVEAGLLLGPLNGNQPPNEVSRF